MTAPNNKFRKIDSWGKTQQIKRSNMLWEVEHLGFLDTAGVGQLARDLIGRKFRNDETDIMNHRFINKNR